ncbi:uncharacterized protein LOC134249873 [Saccostrea cucullata]|uniref:uncharacterized protein LOC134249873 n=1 Tax=Saccostrea cuccullata TaxID=36930 RepID=UPI002ED37818
MAVLTSPIINNTEGSYCFLMQYRALGDILLNIFLTIGDNFVELWNDPIKDLTWQILRVDLEKVSGNFQLFLTASDPQRQNIPEGIIPPRQNVSVSIDYTDLRSGPCNPSMIVEEVPDVIENGPIPVPDVNNDRFEFLDFRRHVCGFDVSTCLWKRSGWDISNKSFNTQDALVPKGSFLKYDSYSSNFEPVVLNSPIINNTEGSYCFIMQYQMIGNGDFYILLEDGLYRPLIWRGRFKNLEWHILRLDLEAASDFRLTLAVGDDKRQSISVRIDYTDLRSGQCDPSMIVEEIPNVFAEPS